MVVMAAMDKIVSHYLAKVTLMASALRQSQQEYGRSGCNLKPFKANCDE